MKVLRINTITSEGRKADDTEIVFHPIDPETGKPFAGDDGQPSVVLVLRPISNERAKKIEAEHTEPTPIKGVLVEKTDYDGVRNAKVQYAVVSWSGFIGADNKPLPCIDACKDALDWQLKNEIIARASLAQPVEVTAESFRQPPPVSGVVG